MGGVARIVSLMRKGGRLSERYGISGSEAWPSSRAVFDVEVLSCSFLFVFLLCFQTLGSFGQYPAPSFSFLCNLLYLVTARDRDAAALGNHWKTKCKF